MEGATKSFPTTNSRNFGRIARDIASDMVATCRGLVATQPHHMCREERIGCPLQTTHPDASLTHRACSLETQWLATLPRFRLRRTWDVWLFRARKGTPTASASSWSSAHLRSVSQHGPCPFTLWRLAWGAWTWRMWRFHFATGSRGVTLLRCCFSVADQRLPCATACSKDLFYDGILVEHSWTACCFWTCLNQIGHMFGWWSPNRVLGVQKNGASFRLARSSQGDWQTGMTSTDLEADLPFYYIT